MPGVPRPAGGGGGGGGGEGEGAEDPAGRRVTLGIEDLVALQDDRVGAGLGGGEIAARVYQPIGRQHLRCAARLGAEKLRRDAESAWAGDQEIRAGQAREIDTRGI